MALGLSSTHGRNESGIGISRRTSPYFVKKSGTIAMNAKDSLVEFKRDRSNVRPYVRSSTQKLKWTLELHQCFMRAVKQLGGKDKATPKRILQQMNKDEITIAHVKSHLQMYRNGKINAEGMPNTVTFSVDGRVPAQSRSNSEDLSRGHSEEFLKEAREVHLALGLLKEGRISGAAGAETVLKTFPENRAFKRHKTSEGKLQLEEMETREFVPIVELNDEYQPNSWSAPCLESFLDKTSTDNVGAIVIDSQCGRKRKAEEAIELNLTMATRSPSPRIQFPCPSTPEEATLSLGLS